MVGMERQVTLYRKADGWAGVELAGVSVSYAQIRKSTDSRDKAGRHRIDQGVLRKKAAKIRIPAGSIPEGLTVEVGDVILLGQGPQALNSPSQPRSQGWPYVIVEQVEDRRWVPFLPHIAVTGC